MGYKFEWDPRKAAANLKKHDPDHSEGVQRFIVLGTSARSRCVVVSYTERSPRTRIISARLAKRQEERQYEEQ